MVGLVVGLIFSNVQNHVVLELSKRYVSAQIQHHQMEVMIVKEIILRKLIVMIFLAQVIFPMNPNSMQNFKIKNLRFKNNILFLLNVTN